MRAGLDAALGLVLLAALLPGAAAAAPDVATTVTAAAGLAALTPPDDAAGEPTLLYGTGFYGPALRLGVAADLAAGGPLWIGLELGVDRLRLTGRAERDQFSRTMTLSTTALDVALRISATPHRTERVRPLATFALGVRAGLAASASETVSGFDDASPPLDATTSVAPTLSLAVGALIPVRSIDIPISLRATAAPATPDSTRQRLVGYHSVDDPGAVRVDATWTCVAELGVRIP
ncbi:MAG: hypothetical protein H6698_00970 [Myxococcales bacterium]|nr:hypothetical protein [Myxococcales bacterium]MCB9530962.1 hypothetical protein [Myxococcales bacterium]MCB9532882.1 hypothetical protein [Myxococcales bacterium]